MQNEKVFFYQPVDTRSTVPVSSDLLRTVLVIDDCLEDRETYRRYLFKSKEYNYIIVDAKLGRQGLELFQTHKPDLVLLDYLLPDIDGLELFTQLKKLQSIFDTPVIILTGEGSEEIAVQAMKLGASDYLIKGEISCDKLQLAVNNAVEKAQLHRRLRESEERLRLALDAVRMGTWEWNLQTNAMIFSEYVRPMLGLFADESLPNNYETFLNIVHPADRERLQHVASNAIASGEKQDVEFRVVWTDGTERWLQIVGKLYTHQNGQPRSLIGTVLDVTESKQAELAKRLVVERERIITQIAASIRQSLNLDVILDTTVQEVRQFLQTDRVVIFRLMPNGCGTVVTESIGSEWVPISTTIFDPCLTKNYIEAYSQGLVTAKTDIYTADIDPCHLELLSQFSVRANLVVPILQGKNLWGLLIAHHCSEPREWLSVEIDLLMQLTTQVGIAIQQGELLESEKAARELAEKANRIKDEFLAVLSHELRSPLNPILGWAGLLKEGKLDSKKIAQAATIIERNVHLQVGLIDDLLDVSRILRGKLVLNSSPVNLESIVTSALEAVQLSAKVKAIQINTVLEPNIKPVLGDNVRLHQIVWNLLSNAVKFTPQRGCISVRLEEINEMAQITVSDTGKGIKREFLPYIFDYFRQEDSSTTRNFGGLGLGLAIARHLVELNGGTICAESAGIGQGATFTICLPLMVSTHDVGNEVTSSSLNLNGINILVVDDEADSLNFIAFLLNQAGATVTAVSSSVEALDILARWKPDILISDIGMPEINGYMLVETIREQGVTIPAIALTAYAGELDHKQALTAGFQKHLSKPVDIDSLMQAIGSLLKK